MAKSKEEVKEKKDLKKGKEIEATYVEKKTTKKKKDSSVEKKKTTEKKTIKAKTKTSQKKESTKEREKAKPIEKEEITTEIIEDSSFKEEKIRTEEESVSYKKAYSFPRILAYIIDFIIVMMLSTLVLTFVPTNKNYEAYLNEYQTIQAEFLEGSLDPEEYVNKSVDIVYDIDYSNVIPMIIEISILILYYVVFQFYNKGQTIGKKLLKIRVVSEDLGEASMNQYIVRSLIVPSIASKMLIVSMVLFMGRRYYYYGSFTMQGIQIVLIIISVFMIMYSESGRGLHDRLAKTKVIMTD